MSILPKQPCLDCPYADQFDEWGWPKATRASPSRSPTREEVLAAVRKVIASRILAEKAADAVCGLLHREG